MSYRILFFSICFCVFLCLSSKVKADNKKFVLVIDAGHGGHDRGATRGKYVEKNINLAVALAFGKLVEQNMPDVKVIYTRKTDIYVPLIKRANMANRSKANAFISIHVNSSNSPTTKACGVETYALGPSSSEASLAVAQKENSVIKLEENYKQTYEGFNPSSLDSYIIFEFMNNLNMKQSLDFANMVQKSAKENRRINRGARQAGLLVLKESSMPAILIELGFVNNPEEAKFLGSIAGQQKMGRMIYNAFKEFKHKSDLKGGDGNISVSNNKLLPVPQTKQPAKEVVPTAVQANNKSKIKTNQSLGQKNGKVLQAKKNEDVKKTSKSKNESPIFYKVQFLSAPKTINPNSPQLKGLPKVSYYKDGKSYKYTAGETTNKAEIIRIQNIVRKKYKDAFVVKFQDGKRI